MILVHSLSGKDVYLNCDLIESIESMPDTKINFTTGKYFIVSEPAHEIVARVIAYNQSIYSNQKKVIFEHRVAETDLGTDY